jgi:hypothetical protein
MKPSKLKIGNEQFQADTKPQVQTIRVNAETFSEFATILGLEKNDKDGKWQRGSSDAVSKVLTAIVNDLKTKGKVELSTIKEEVNKAK